MQRILLGLIALAFFVGGFGLMFSGLAEFWTTSLAYIAMRIGMVLGALWLALPQVQFLLERLSPTLIAVFFVAAIVLTVRPKLIVYIVPLLVAILVVHYLGHLLVPPPRRRRKRGGGG